DLVFRANGGQRVASAAGWELIVRERVSDQQGFLFVVNPQPLPRSACITYRNPRTRRMETIPQLAEAIELVDQGGLVLTLETPVGPHHLRYSTSQLQAVEVDSGEVRLKLYGHPGTVGEAALAMASPPDQVAADGRAPLAQRFEAGVLTVTYRHTGESTWLTL